jgi:hypothetical protein
MHMENSTVNRRAAPPLVPTAVTAASVAGRHTEQIKVQSLHAPLHHPAIGITPL